MKMNRLSLLSIISCLVVLIACGAASDPTPGPTSTFEPAATSTPEPLEPVTISAHRFLQVGQSASIADLGEILEVASIGTGQVLAHDEANETVSCTGGGAGFVRARYRAEGVQKNQVQTMAMVCIDEVGDCAGQTPAALNLEQFLEGEPTGEANYLAQGTGDLYGVCVVDGRYRLQQAPVMPPPMLRLIDAPGNGPYTLSTDDLDLLDRGGFVSYSGEEYSPSWIATVAPEIQGLVIDPGGTVFMVEMSCSQYPGGCLGGTPLVRSGDMLVINFGVDLQQAVDSVPFEVIRQFVAAHIDFDWSGTAQWEDPEARMTIVHRLVSLEIMRRLLVSFDRFYDLRESGITVGYMPYWATRTRVTSHFSPDGPEWAECEEVEALLDAHEREQIAEWRAEGYDLWHFEILGHDSQGNYRPLMDSAPSFDAFAGAAVSVEIGGQLDQGDKATVMANAIESMAEEVGTQPVIISANWGPMGFVVNGTPCEDEICPSAFSPYFEAHEKLVAAMLSSFEPDQVEGFGVALFDGGVHFDIREPYENYGGFSLNRVGETGFNSPLMNLYLAR